MGRFVTDGMLGKLTRWLRLAGCDVVYVGDLNLPPERQDSFLIDLARSEDRELLTSDLGLHIKARKSGVRSTFIGPGEVVSQMVELCRKTGRRIDLDPEKARCPACNGELVRAEKKSVAEVVPRRVLEEQDEFWRCKSCGKAYWKGKQWRSILKVVKRYNQLMK
ncbi:MAG: Mut7-C RNAse domain-containing protein [Candidatus Hadarchaeales archaeon]